MNDLGLTHLESLDEETITIPGLDVEADLATTIAKGKRKIRQRRTAAGISIFSAVVLLAAIAGSIAAFTGNDTPTRVRTADKKTSKVKVAETEVTTTPTSLPLTTTTVPVTTAPPAPVIKDIVLTSFGSASQCTPPESVNQPNEDGVIVGTSDRVDTATLSVGQTYQAVSDSGNVVTLVAKAHSNAPGGIYLDLKSGFLSSGFAKISTMSFMYCEPGLKVQAQREDNGSFSIGQETWTP